MMEVVEVRFVVSFDEFCRLKKFVEDVRVSGGEYVLFDVKFVGDKLRVEYVRGNLPFVLKKLKGGLDE